MLLAKINNDLVINNIKYKELLINSGDFVFIKGISGSGKTTLMKLLSGFQKPTSGSVTFCDDFSGNIGFYFHDFYLLENYSIKENIILNRVINGQNDDLHSIEKDFQKYSDIFDVGDIINKDIKLLSSGEYQRICLLRAFLLEKNILILDEPTSFLDEQNKNKVLSYLKKINDSGITILLSSHDIGSLNFFKGAIKNNAFKLYNLDENE